MAFRNDGKATAASYATLLLGKGWGGLRLRSSWCTRMPMGSTVHQAAAKNTLPAQKLNLQCLIIQQRMLSDSK